MSGGRKPQPRRGRERGMRVIFALLGYFISIALVLFALYQGFQQALLKSINTLNTDFIRQVNNTSSLAENILQNLSAQVFNTRSVIKLRTYAALSNADMIEGMRALNAFIASSAAIDSIYVYNGKQNYIYSTVSFGAVSDSAALFRDRGAVKLFRALTPSMSMLPIGRESEASSNSANKYLYSLLFFDTGKSGAGDNALMLNISGQWLSQLYFGRETEAPAFILNDAGQVAVRREGLDEDLYTLLSPRVVGRVAKGETDGYFEYKSGQGERMLCFFSKMGAKPWIYVRAMPYAKYLSGLTEMEQSAYTVFLTVVLAVVAAGFLIAWRVYFPFRRMADSLSETGRESVKELTEKLNAMVSRSFDVRRIEDQLRNVMKDEALRSMLIGGRTPGEATDMAGEYGLSLRMDRPMTPLLVNSIRLAQYAAAARQFYERVEGVCLKEEHTVLLLQGDAPADRAALCGALLAVNPQRVVVLGEEVASCAELPEAYAILAARFRLRFLNPQAHILYPAAEKGGAGVPYSQRAERILQALKGGDKAQAMEQYEAFVEGLRSGTDDRGAAFAIRQMAFSVLALGREVCSPDPVQEHAEGERLEALLKELSDVGALTAWCDEQFLRIVDRVRRERLHRQETLLDSVRAAIDAEYADPALTSQELATRFSMSAAYLCRVFRQSQGISLPDAINARRIRAARELLQNTGERIKDIALRVGIENSQYFFVLFKQVTGETPGEYRKRCASSKA